MFLRQVKKGALSCKLGLLAPALAGLASCTELADPAETCVGDEDCAESIVEPDSDTLTLSGADLRWSCLDEDVPRPEGYDIPESDPDIVLFVVDLVNPSNLDPIQNVTFKLCPNSDINCDDRFQTFLAPIRPQRSPASPYTFQVGLPYRIADFYLRIEAEGHVTLDYYFSEELNFNFGKRTFVPDPESPDPNNPNMLDAEVAYIADLALPTIPAYESYYADVARGIGENREAGVVLGRVFDCLGNVASGVQIAAPNLVEPEAGQPGIIPVGYSKGVPSRYDGVSITGEDGVAGYANAVPSSVRVEAINERGDNYVNATLRAAARQIGIADMRPPNAYRRILPPGFVPRPL